MKQAGRVFIVNGPQGKGKTTYALSLIQLLQEKAILVRGFYAKGYWKQNKRSRFDLVNIQNQETHILCQTQQTENWLKLAHFWFNPQTITWGEKILSEALQQFAQLIIMDEIGKLEIQGFVWHNILRHMINTSESHILLVIRDQFVRDVIDHFRIKNHLIFDIQTLTPEKASEITYKAIYPI